VRVDRFSDKEVGQESRNNKSAMLANIILDNAKYGFADSLGEFMISQMKIFLINKKKIQFVLKKNTLPNLKNQ